ncbi:unnamed protein product [Caenorhabditis auriculariae]|uniref:1-acyl-sn-glycerol-3-phosphate acyltransferase n=1 Tax=Caenorhabditis auriculariae TaxID=2777116 RepID=A0A8S1H225_9PELO|nr:unnamed protein product [Caenorhabditis auriculariae]
MTEQEKSNTFYYMFLVIAFVLACLFTKLGFYVKMFFFGLCLVFGGLVGGFVSVPFGKSPQNHFRMFKIFQTFCMPLGISIDVRHHERLKSNEPFIIIANHQSCLDVLVMTHVWPKNCVVMLKSSLKWLPGFNLCAYMCESIYINRFSKEKAHKTVDTTLAEILDKKRKVWMYPEGTRNSEPQMLPFKKGAFLLAKQAKCPVVCCAFSSYNNFYNHAEKRFDFGGKVIVDVLPPVDSEQFEDVDDLSKHCYKLIQERREQLDKEL